MKSLNIAEARQNFSALVDEIRCGGESVVISKYGRPAVLLTRFTPPPIPAAGGCPSSHHDWRDELGLRDNSFVLPPDFDEPTDNMWEVFDGKAEEQQP